MALGFAVCASYYYVRSNIYKPLLEGVKSNDFSLMDEVHHLSSGMKSLHTQITNDGL